MKELDALAVWNALPMPQRAALLAALPYQPGADSTIRKWAELSGDVRDRLLKLDWNFMLGGKLGVK